jgi:hypothetical protein
LNKEQRTNLKTLAPEHDLSLKQTGLKRWGYDENGEEEGREGEWERMGTL